MILIYPFVASVIFTFLPISPPAGSTPHQWVGGSIIPLQMSLLVFNWFIGSVQIDDTNLSYGYRFFPLLFCPFHPLQALLLPSGWGHPWSLFGNPYGFLFSSFYLFKLRKLTYPSIAGFIFTFSHFSPPAGPTPHWWVYPLSLLVRHYWHLIGSLYSFKSTILSYPMVAELFSRFRTISRWGLGACITMDSEEK